MASVIKIYALFLGSALLMFGGGLQGLLLSVRGAEEGFSLLALGLIGTGWSVGFVAGSIAVPLIVRKVGHIRAFSVMAAIGTVTILLNLLMVNDVSWILLRALSGFCFAGAAMIVESWLNEVADNRSRGTIFSVYTTINMAASTVGQLAMSVTGTTGYIPFVIGAMLAITAMFMRRHMHETESFTEANKNPVKRESSIRGLMRYPREIAIVVGLTAGGTAAFYTFTTYMQTFVRQTAGFSDITTTYVIAGSLIFAAILQPIYGAISDRIGRKPLLIFFGVAGTLLTVPLLTTLAGTKSPWIAFLLISGAWVFVAGYTSINAVVKAELFPTSIRATGVAVPYALTVSIFGGTAPAIALFFKQQGHEQWFYYYLAGVIFVSLLVYATMRDTKHQSAMHRHD